ncbi:MAG: adenine phosphoribosyltransferase [Alphaproteobacteria bacterium]|nr:adenine phosphoribosyltransferase [Alphaproteobacteria bacterium]MCB1840980.1 adenine phosphoribosyltransferase [Alphaproteobacteria bacterium]
MNILEHIAVVPDFPKPGINFYDIQSLLKNPALWDSIVERLVEKAEALSPDIILGIESRGFLTGLSVAQQLSLPFAMVRKKGKLPGAVIRQDYALEYGSDTIEIQNGMIEEGMKVVIADDLLATGGTMRATGDLVRKVGGTVSLGLCIIELHELNGRKKLDFPFAELVQAPLDPFAAGVARAASQN